MRALAVDDKPTPRRALVSAIQEARPDMEITACANADEVLALSDLESYNVAFVDIDMPGKNGIQLARELKAVCPRLNIVFATGYGEFMADAFEMHSSGYIMKPVTAQKVRAELNNLRYPTEDSMKIEGLYVQCFGDFEVFANGETLDFERAKTKELFAYLVDRRGALCFMPDIEAALWEGEAGKMSRRSYIRTLIADMKTTLDKLGFKDVVVKRRGAVGVNPSGFVCDYYKFTVGDPVAIATFGDEYMRQYPWAQQTLEQIRGGVKRTGH